MRLIDPENTKVILIGTSEIKDKNYSSIPNVIDNLTKLRELLCTVVGIDKNNIFMFIDKKYWVEISEEIIEIIPKVTDTMIVYFAGHCIRSKQELYFTTTRTLSDDPKSTGAIFADDLFQTVIENSKKAKSIIFIIDCCLSGLASKYIDDKGKDIFLITATSSVQTAKKESPKKNNHTAFSLELLHILEYGIDNVGERLSINNIFDALKQRLINQDLPEPEITSHGSPNEFFLCKNNKSTKPEPNQNVDTINPDLITTPTISLIQAEINVYLDNILLDPDELDKRYIDLSANTETKVVLPSKKGNIIPPEFQIIKQHFHPVQEESKSLDSISEALNLHNCFILLGDPGSGKSTTLKKLQLDSAKLARQNSQARIPILINLALWHDEIVDLQEFLNIQFQNLPFLPLNKWLILLDGLNEMPSKKYVQRIKMFENWLQYNKDISVIIGCRERYYQQNKKLSLPTVQIAPFDAKRIQRFLQVYLGSEQATQLLNQLGCLEPQQRSARDLISLADNPYLLSLICFVYTENNRQLPNSRGRLFQMFVQVLYKREHTKRTTEGISYDDLVLGLSEMAFAMQNLRSSTSVHTAWAIKQIPDKFSVDALWNLGREASLLNFSKGEQIVQFSHQLILEYLAAEGLLRRFANLSHYIKKTGFFKNKRRNGAWDEVVYTLVGITDANKLFLKLAEIDPLLTVDCFEHVSQEFEIHDETIKFISDKIINLFGSRNPQAREAAILKAIQLGNITLPYLIDLLENGNKAAKRASLKALSEFDEPLAFKTIVLALKNSNKWVRKDAEEILDSIEASKFESLVEKQDKNIIAVLEKYDYIKSQSVNVRLYAIKYLKKVGDTKIVDKLIPYLQDEHSAVRDSTIQALAKLGDAQIINKILPYLENQNAAVRRSIIQALTKLGDVQIIDKLIPYLQDENSLVRYATIEALTQLGDAQIIDKLIPYLQDENLAVRCATIQVLTKLGNAQIIDKLIPYLQDENLAVRNLTIQALTKLGDAQIIDNLIPCLEDKDSQVRHITIKALLELGYVQIIDKLHTYKNLEPVNIKSNNLTSKARSIKTLGELGYKQVIDDLIPYLKDEHPVIKEVTKQALKQLGYEPH